MDLLNPPLAIRSSYIFLHVIHTLLNTPSVPCLLICKLSSIFPVVYAALLYNGVTSQVKTVHVLSSRSGQLSTVGVVETGWTAFTTFHSLATV